MIAHYMCARVMEMATAARDGGSGAGVHTSTAAAADAPSGSTPSSSPLSPSGPSSIVVSVDTDLIVDGDAIDKTALLRLHALLEKDGYSANSNTRVTQMYETPPLPLRALYEAGFRNAYASEFAKSFACAHNNELYAVVRYCGLSPHSDASAEVMGRLLHLRLPTSSTPVLASRLPWVEEDQAPSQRTVARPLNAAEVAATRMFDSFLLTDDIVACAAMTTKSGANAAPDTLDALLTAAVEQPPLQPYCPCPYTCWDQSRNRRLENVGTRLDYILVDEVLLPAVQCRQESANNVFSATTSTPASRADFFSEVNGAQCRDGILRAMAGGAYPPAPFDGSGMPALAEGARELCCAGLPASGLFVTPPQFSDHVGVGLVLDLTRIGHARQLAQRPGKIVEDHKCMYRPPVGLHTFFAAAAAKKATSADESPPSAPSNQHEAEPAVGQKRSAGESESSMPANATQSEKCPRTEQALASEAPATADEVEVVDVDEL